MPAEVSAEEFQAYLAQEETRQTAIRRDRLATYIQGRVNKGVAIDTVLKRLVKEMNSGAFTEAIHPCKSPVGANVCTQKDIDAALQIMAERQKKRSSVLPFVLVAVGVAALLFWRR